MINANPPWGAYELKPGEEPLRAGGAVGGLSSAKPKPGKVVARLDASEALDARLSLLVGKHKRAGKKLQLATGTTKAGVGYAHRFDGKRAKLVAKLTDAAGDSRKEARWVKLKPHR